MTPTLPGLDGCRLPGVDPALIDAQWRALQPPYDVERWRIPLPVWAVRPYDHNGVTAWDVLRQDLESAPASTPMCIYLHVPFCSDTCGFCDCYSFALPARHDDHRRRYMNRLLAELALWSDVGPLRRRPVSTVHLGGGSPAFLGPDLLAELCAHLRDRFATSDDTEWALESTAHGLSDDVVGVLQENGFRRLHVGVQTLQDPVRKAIGRVSPASVVLRCIGESLDRGWTVSTDMICGLPGQTLPAVVDDMHTLIAAGVNGVSLYELLIYRQNRRWATRHGLIGRSHLGNYVMYQAAAQLLEANGYRKNTFNHWADPADRNLYFTFPLRGEDCLAVGTIADGVFGSYHFRHPRYRSYLNSPTSSPGLEGGLRRTHVEEALHRLTTAILSGTIAERLLQSGLTVPQASSLVQRWAALGLVRDDGDHLQLLTNGSWFAGNMIRELADVVGPDR